MHLLLRLATAAAIADVGGFAAVALTVALVRRECTGPTRNLRTRFMSLGGGDAFSWYPVLFAHNESYGYSSTWPLTQMIVPPPTQIVPSSSREIWIRPARPSAVP
jgi:hypothetical protein